MNFYASPEYLAVVAEAHFKGKRASVEDVRIGNHVLRVLVVDAKEVITNVDFLDYHVPIADVARISPTREHTFARWVAQGVIEQKDWNAELFEGFEPAPFVDWSRFPTWDDYLAYLKTRQKGLLQEHARRRRRLAEKFGELEFCADDKGSDVLELAQRWKQNQLHETGANDYLADPKNQEYLRLARERGIALSSTLRAGKRLLSAWIGFKYQRVWSGWIFAYDHDPALRKYSVGHQLLHSMLEESHRCNDREFDFSIGAEDYKWFYATHARLLGPIGRAPLAERLFTAAKRQAKKALSLNPMLRDMATTLRNST